MGKDPEHPSEDRFETQEARLPSIKLSIHGVTTRDLPKVRRTGLDEDHTVLQRPADSRQRRAAAKGDLIAGRYIVEGALGRGGMGRVLHVRHRALGKAFALKVIKVPIAQDPRFRNMFYREARLASGLNHGNICSVVDFGDDEQFGLFMVMELLEGVTLYRKRKQDGRFAPKVACDIISQVAEAVHYIHNRAIVHGDIKSENAYLVRAPERRRLVKLLDFGLARAEAVVQGDKKRLEGTPEYLAPERIVGAPASQQSDIYALGILFFELLVGKVPFSGELRDVFHNQVHTDVPKAADLLDTPLDERADEIIARATAKDPDERHQDVAGFLYELRTLMTMLGMDQKRRPRGALGGAAKSGGQKRTADMQAAAQLELLHNAPIALAAITKEGNVRAANRSFCEFIGVPCPLEKVELLSTGLVTVYPDLDTNIQECRSTGQIIKCVFQLSDGGDELVDVALILSPPSEDNPSEASGDVHLALHPLGRNDASSPVE